MGLDCFVQKNRVQTDGKVTADELWYGRKTNAIHGWMQRQSGIEPVKFNCVDFYLTEELLVLLENYCAAGNLTATEGFFFGDSLFPDVVRDVHQIVFASRQALSQGEFPYYFSWW